jgi:hypothetical protein
MEFRSEDRLLICLSRARLENGNEQEALALLKGELDWTYLRAAARAQGVAGLCYARLAELGRKHAAVPEEALQDAARAIAARSLLLASRLVTIVESLNGCGIRAVSYKGPALAIMNYGDLAARDFIDLDLIIRHEDLRSVWNVLEGEGYRPEPSTAALPIGGNRIPGQYEFASSARDYLVEVHTERTLRHFPRSLTPERLFASLKTVEILNRRVETFSPSDAMVFLAVHHAKDFWSRLLWLSDFAHLSQVEGFDWDHALTEAGCLGCIRMVRVGVLLSDWILRFPVPAHVLTDARADASARERAQWLASRLFNYGPIEPWEQLRYRMAMVEGFWPGVRYAARLATTPAADDWSAVRLPAPLGFAYALLRPLRLFRR